MAFPKLLQKLFQSDGAGDKLREDIMPKEYLPLTGGTVTGDLTTTGLLKGTYLQLCNGVNNNTAFLASDGTGGGFFLSEDDHSSGDWVQILTTNSSGVGGVCPPGAMIAYAGTSVPWGWLLCNGAAISRTTYKNLFNAIGTTWGSGDGSTTFNLPSVDERYFEPTTASNCVGMTADAQLPNIAGGAYNGARGFVSIFQGAFGNSTSLGNFYDWGKEGSMFIKDGFNFSASLSNSTYGRTAYGEGEWVRPRSFRAFMLIKW